MTNIKLLRNWAAEIADFMEWWLIVALRDCCEFYGCNQFIHALLNNFYWKVKNGVFLSSPNFHIFYHLSSRHLAKNRNKKKSHIFGEDPQSVVDEAKKNQFFFLAQKFALHTLVLCFIWSTVDAGHSAGAGRSTYSACLGWGKMRKMQPRICGFWYLITAGSSNPQSIVRS